MNSFIKEYLAQRIPGTPYFSETKWAIAAGTSVALVDESKNNAKFIYAFLLIVRMDTQNTLVMRDSLGTTIFQLGTLAVGSSQIIQIPINHIVETNRVNFDSTSGGGAGIINFSVGYQWIRPADPAKTNKFKHLIQSQNG